MAASIIEAYCDIEEAHKEHENEGPFRRAEVRKFGAFASFVGNHFLQSIKRRHISLRKKNSVHALDFHQIEEDEIIDGVESLPVSTFHRVQSNQPRSLKSPRRVIQAQIPNGASQQVRMDLILLSECPSIEDLKKSTWKGCSAGNRAQVWRMLVGYEPLNYAERNIILRRRREEYREYLRLLQAPDGAINLSLSGRIDPSSSTDDGENHLDRTNSTRECRDRTADEGVRKIAYSSFSAKTLRQIEMDLPRTHPDVAIFHVDEVRNAMRRILYVFGILNPNNNYVQGMNEILTPVLVVFLSDYLKGTSKPGVDNFLKRASLRGDLTGQQLADAEADAFWMFTHIVSLIEDNFVTDQPGILRRVARLEEIVRRVDPILRAHLAKNGNEFIQFSFRWMNCLLMRELPFSLVIRIWDAFLAVDDGMCDLHVYFCAAMLTRFTADLLTMDFEDSILFLQHLPTVGWDVKDIDELLSQALVWKQSLQLTSLAKKNEGSKC